MSLAFILTTYPGDAHLAHRLLWQLGTYHPRVPKIVITDGPLEDWQIRALEGLCDHLERGEALGQDTSRPTAWLTRMLSVALEHSSTEIIVKLDPDAYMTRAIRGYPGADLFGSLYPDGTIQGGVYGFRRSLAQQILEHRVLEHPDLQLLQMASPLPVNEERQISQAARALSLRIEIWGDVCSRAHPEWTLEQVSARYAVWHPLTLPMPEGMGFLEGIKCSPSDARNVP